MILAGLAVVSGLMLLVWSADRFVDGSAMTARYFGMPSLLIGMLIVGFGTSAPEMIVSAISAAQGNPGIALGNAYGSNISNIGLILGLTALVNPIRVHSQILRKELPVLAVITLLAAFQLWDNELSRVDASVLLGVFGGLLLWTIRQGLQKRTDILSIEVEHQLQGQNIPIKKAFWGLVSGLVLLVASSRMLVWGAVKIAQGLGVSDLIIGLTIVAVGTSLPELASSLVATRKGEPDIALGNVIGSNIFNTLLVVGLAGMIQPMTVGPEVFYRDMPVMTIFTFSLFLLGYGFKGSGRINRLEGAILLAGYLGYMTYLVTRIFDMK